MLVVKFVETRFSPCLPPTILEFDRTVLLEHYYANEPGAVGKLVKLLLDKGIVTIEELSATLPSGHVIADVSQEEFLKSIVSECKAT